MDGCQAGVDSSATFEFRFGSGPGIRTLNLAVNRSLHPVQKWRLEFAECRRVPPIATACHRRCCTEGLGRSICDPHRVEEPQRQSSIFCTSGKLQTWTSSASGDL